MKVKIWEISGYRGSNDWDDERDNNFSFNIAMDARITKNGVENFFMSNWSKKYRTVVIYTKLIEEKEIGV